MKSVIEVYSEIARKNPRWNSAKEWEFIQSCLDENGKWKDKEHFVNEAFKHNIGLVFDIFQKTAFDKNEDVFQKAVIAMVDALRRYNPHCGSKISTWVTNPIRWAILHHQNTYSKERPIVDEISSLNRKYNLKMSVVSMDSSIGGTDEQDTDTIENSISASNVHPDYVSLCGLTTTKETVRNRDIKRGIKTLLENASEILTEREIYIIKGLLCGRTMADISIDLKLTRMRISQISADAFNKIRKSNVGKRLKELLN